MRLGMMGLFLAAMILLVFWGCGQSPDQSKEKPAVQAAENPFLSSFDTPFNVPPFDKIEEEHYLPAIREGIRQQKEEIAAIVDNPDPPDFNNTIAALDRSGALVNQVQHIFDAMKSVITNPKLQEIANEVSPLIAGHEDDILLNKKLFQRVKTVYQQKDQLNLNEEELQVLEDYYNDFVRGGANLDDEKQDKLREINKKLSVLKLKFGNHVLAETERFKLIIDKKEDLSGLPENVISVAAETIAQQGLENKWVFTIQKPSLIPFLQFSDRRELREKMFKAYINQCNHGDELDNKALIIQILKLRKEKAQLLGFKNFAQFKLDQNMAKTPKAVYDFLYKVWEHSIKVAKKEAKELQKIIDKEGKNFKLQPWDWWYYVEKVKKAKYDIDANLTKPYFKLENVRDGAFYVANRLYGLKFIPRQDIPKYHPDVQVYEVQEADGSHVGVLYMDFYARAGKRGGAWMNNLREQSRLNGKRIAPVVTNNGNFPRPTADTPSLLDFDQVETLFHEFGHGLHGLLGNSTYEKVSGTNVPIDFVELPSQIMENWTLEPDVLKVYAKHYKTGEVIPTELVEKIKKSKLFNQGFKMTERISAALLDMDWHTAENPEKLDVIDFETKCLNRIGLIPEIVVRYRSTYYRHVFSSSYPAGYYSYAWAEVLDADAFNAFKETSLFDQDTAQAFRKNILEKGGTTDPMVLYKRFRHAEPKIEPMLKRKGLI